MSSNPTGPERRVHERLAVTVTVQVAWEGGAFTGFSTDLSESGIFVETPELLPEGTPVRLRFGVYGQEGKETVLVEGTVVRSLPPNTAEAGGRVPGIGIRFEELLFGAQGMFEFLTERLEAVRRAPDQVPTTTTPRDARALIGLPVFWGTESSLDHEGLLYNLSTSGAFLVETKAPEPLGTRISLWFELPIAAVPKFVKATAKVTRVSAPGEDGPSGMGITFEASTVDTHLIGLFLDGRLRWKPGKTRTPRPREPVRPREPEKPIAQRAEPAPGKRGLRWRRSLLLIAIATFAGIAASLLLVLLLG